MDHPEAIRLMAVEKYLLNELSPELRRSFEEHLFECKECEFDVQAGYALIDGSKEALSFSAVEIPKAVVPGKPNQWLSWLRPAIAVPVMALLLIVVGYQNLVTVPTLKNEVAVAPLHTPTPNSFIFRRNFSRSSVVSMALMSTPMIRTP